MNPNEEQFDDFKVAEESPEMENVVANTIVAKELTEVEQYKSIRKKCLTKSLVWLIAPKMS